MMGTIAVGFRRRDRKWIGTRSFASMLRRCSARLRILGQSADAEDVTQEVFLEAYQFQRSQAIRSWPAMLRRMAVCRALDRLRRRRPDVSINDRSLMSSCGEPESDAIAAELSARLSEAIGQLPEREAEVFCLRYFEDLSNGEIADSLGIQAGAVAAGCTEPGENWN